ncbi:MAG: FkbM family methyltransferase [Anaerolineae bacterium]|nr:FkbM family methyltransferase [Anaerolineae bacterium]
MKAYQVMRDAYIKYIRRNRFIHQSLYWVARKILFPVWESAIDFRTHPDDPLSIRFSMLSGEYEKETVKLVNRFVKPGAIALDIGAHIGYYTRILARAVGASGRVIAFEPHPETSLLLIKNTTRFRNVIVLRVAAADKEGVLSLYDGQLETGMSGLCDLEEYRQYTKQLSTEFTPRARQGYPFRSFTVEARPVEQCLSELGITSVDFVKIDIEGAEMKAFEGMKRLISASPNLTMVMEFNPRLIQAFGFSPRGVINALRSYGFTSIEAIYTTKLTTIDTETDEFDNLVKELTENFSMVNLLCRKTHN